MLDASTLIAIILATALALILLDRKKSTSSGSSRRFEKILDRYETLEDVAQALRVNGLESSNLIIGIDFTASNEWTGQKTFDNKCLHTISSNMLNPYQSVISILGKTLEEFDEDNLIPVYGFGDSRTKDKAVFTVHGDKLCYGFNGVLESYNQVTPTVHLSGPTSFAPLIRQAIEIVKKEKSYHILVIVADGQVVCVDETIRAIVDASHYPLSIIMVGVGDGPWDCMEQFDDELPQRKFDNFQFVPFHEIMQRARHKEAAFALSALMEIPDQFKAIKNLGLLSL